jgi:hypothetical protein
MDRLKDLLGEDQVKEEKGTSPGSVDIEREIEVYAYDVEEALKSAAKALGTSIVNLQYQVLERGSAGVMGMGRKPYKFLVFITDNEKTGESFAYEGLRKEIRDEELQKNRDGSFTIKITKDGIFLKVEPPRGRAKKVELQEIIKYIQGHEIAKYDEESVKREVDHPRGRPVRIADYSPSQYDSHFQIQVSPDEMKAYLTMTKPEKYGRMVDIDEVISALKSKNVQYGLKKEAIVNAVENELYNMPVIVAEGDMPIEGRDSQIKYHFKIDQDTVKFEVAEDGNVDFHKLDNVQSVVVGQVLATKETPEKGRAGKTISGRIIPARDGKDVKLSTGSNTHLSADGLQIISDINGQAIFKNNKVQVEPVLEINGDVDLTSGDINFPGNVIIYGNVNDTFKVYSGANVEIKGNIGKADVVAEGNIVVRQGIQGKDVAKIICAGDLYAKFIERANVKAEGYVVVSEVILHSNIYCKKKVICAGGKKSQIAGGKVSALYEINAKYLGVEAYTETVLETGLDSEAEAKIEQMHKRKEEIQKEMPLINQQIISLTSLLSAGPLPPDKQETFNQLTLKFNQMKLEMSTLEERIKQSCDYVEGLAKEAKISASKTVYPGVRIKIRNEILAIKTEYKFVTFFRDGGLIKITPYEKSKEMEEKVKGVSRSRNL